MKNLLTKLSREQLEQIIIQRAFIAEANDEAYLCRSKRRKAKQHLKEFITSLSHGLEVEQ